MTGLANVTTTSLSFIVAASGSTPIYTNSGWTQINVYQNQSNNSGSPDATLYRSNMTFSVSNNGTSSATASWTQSGSLGTFAFATYFGSTNGVTNFVEIV
jgi:Tfp pilus assembly protein PilV